MAWIIALLSGFGGTILFGIAKLIFQAGRIEQGVAGLYTARDDHERRIRTLENQGRSNERARQFRNR